MPKARVLCVFLLLCALSFACALTPTSTPTATPSPTSTPTSTPGTPTATVTLTPNPTDTPFPSGVGACQATSTAAISIYSRPSLPSEVFSTITLSLPVDITSRSADGWLGFDPGVAQAANIGVFRLRWIPPGVGSSLTGDCSAIPVEPWVPEPGVCYEMVMGLVDVHAAADTASAVNGTLEVGDFAAVLGMTAGGWVSVDGNLANTPGVSGFIPETELNVNGPCDALPVIP
jgi:hypothetical protein